MGRRIISYNGRYYDFGTQNTSFLNVAKDLRTREIKNWYFMLEIKDPSLIHIDPYAVDSNGETTLTKDQIMRITTECLHNMWYYLREIARIPTPGITGGIPYIANRGNIAQAWCLLRGIDSWLCLPRQQGKTKSALAAQGWAYSFGTRDTKFIFVNKDGENAKTNLSDLGEQIECLPVFLQYESIMEEDGKITKSRKSATKMKHPVTKNEIIIKPAATSYSKALSLARGLSASIIHYDEPEFTQFIDVIIENSVSTFETSARKAKENGAVYGRIFTCTPGDTDTDAGKRAEKLLERNQVWDEHMYDWTDKEIYDYTHAEGKSGIVYIEYSYLQIGLTRQWFNDISKKIGNKLTVRREILLQRLRGSSESPYDRDIIEYLIDIAKKPIEQILIRTYYHINIYKRLNRNIPYIVGIDCATGTVNDNNAMTIINPYTLEVEADFLCSYIGEPEFIELIKELVKKHIPRAILCIERNHVGDAIIAFLLQSEIAGRLYFDKDKEMAEERMKELEDTTDILKAKARMKLYYGVYTQGKSREVMFTILSNHIQNHKEKFISNNVITDIAKLVMKGGKIQAGAGAHDDSIMSYLIALYVFYYGNNLEVFGINKGDLLYLEEHNKGLIHDTLDVELSGLSKDVQEFVEVENTRITKTVSYNDMLEAAMLQSQAESIKLHNAGLVQNETYANTSKMEESYDDFTPENLSIFDELNSW